MANHKSAIKKARMSLRRQAINSKTLTEVRSIEKKLRKAIVAKSKDDSKAALTLFISKVSKAAKNGRLKKETASRKVSRLSKAVSALA
ncbi:MAG: 30S ribosomal protein S20 [Bdellovibrionales bacterium]